MPREGPGRTFGPLLGALNWIEVRREEFRSRALIQKCLWFGIRSRRRFREFSRISTFFPLQTVAVSVQVLTLVARDRYLRTSKSCFASSPRGAFEN